MRFLRTFLPNLTIALNLSLLVVIYLDKRNPMMSFLVGGPFLTLVIACTVCSVATAVVLYRDWRCGRYDGKLGDADKDCEKSED